MCCSSRLPRTKQTGAGGSLARAVALVFVLAIAASSSAQAQTPEPAPCPYRCFPTPPIPTPSSINADISAGSTAANLGSSFLERLGDQATNGFGNALRNNPGGGGASQSSDPPVFRTWGEAYGITANTQAQGNFVGDSRSTVGGVAGVGARIAPGVNIGLSVDQSDTAIDVPLAFQSATLDLTQIGFNASVDKGPWTWALAVVHGFGTVGSRRETFFGRIATASYNAQIDGALTELSYYWSSGQTRIVPKAALEYTRATTGAYQEVGGFDPVAASATAAERARILIGAEVGHYWIVDGKIFDLSGYSKFVDNFVQNFGASTVTLGPESIAVQGVGEGQYGVDAGASASLNVTNAVRVYINYDAKFRTAMQSHQGTLGIEFRW
jgi:uncharacterized protein with beta-barrel porin domain